MPSFSTKSAARLATCHPDLQRLFNAVILERDCMIVCGERNKADQDAAFAAGASKLRYPRSKHNRRPSEAVDVIPSPEGYTSKKAFAELAAVVKRIAKEQGLTVVWGGDWATFPDLPHWQLPD
jgi:peptidoglycan L-alanyl-D-glutamate endopeptidase CwlK